MSPKCLSLAGPHQVVSPELVMIWLSSRKRQHDRYPGERGWSAGSLREGSTTGPPPTTPVPYQASLTSMARQLPADPDIALTSLETVDGADVVQPPTGHKVP